MRIVATMLVGPGTEHMVDAAWRSAARLADALVIVDTRPERGEGWGPLPAHDLHVLRWSWTGSYADARNIALQAARDLGAEYALTIDTDERLNDLGDRHAIEAQIAKWGGPDVVSAKDRERTYQKERFIRCNAPVEWWGITHESVRRTDGKPVPTGVLEGTFWELPKTDEQLQAKFERDLGLLRRQIEEHGPEARWVRYIGDSNMGLEQWEKAADAFAFASQLVEPGNSDVRAWCAVRRGEAMIKLGKWHDAIESACYALSITPLYMREAANVCAFCCVQLKDWVKALRWGELGVMASPSAERMGPANVNAEEGCWQAIHAAAMRLQLQDYMATAVHRLNAIRAEKERRGHLPMQETEPAPETQRSG